MEVAGSSMATLPSTIPGPMYITAQMSADGIAANKKTRQLILKIPATMGTVDRMGPKNRPNITPFTPCLSKKFSL